jgi:hypothetical protein
MERAFPEIKDFPSDFQLQKAGRGSILSEEDLVGERGAYSCTCYCASSNGILYKYSTEVFYSFRETAATWHKLQSQAKSREQKKEGNHIKTQPLSIE